MRRFWFFLFPLALYTVILSTLTHIPLPEQIDLSSGRDKIIHAAAYGFFAFLVLRILGAYHLDKYFWQAAAATLLYGALDEATQLWVAGRFASVEDFFYNALGIAIIFTLYYFRLKMACAPRE